jgi:hypothetical protein
MNNNKNIAYTFGLHGEPRELSLYSNGQRPGGTGFNSHTEFETNLWGPYSLLYDAYRGTLSSRRDGRGVTLTTRLNLVPPSLRMVEQHRQLPHTSSWCGAEPT